ncbi:MAG: septation protein SpoVG family protein [Candidatus Marinimicrobia bacterium]|nr:septation protein SpoVG family protein [Candidatus Neomarinimicrobiota bacterium]
MQIERINKGEWGKVKAFFDLRTEEGLVIKGFKIVEGSNGPFVGFPSRKNSDGEYNDTVYAEADLKQEITRLAMESYGSDVMQSSGAPAGGSSAPSDSPPPFGDDDIPF